MDTFSLFLNSFFETLIIADLSKARSNSKGRNPKDFMYAITRSIAVISLSKRNQRSMHMNIKSRCLA